MLNNCGNSVYYLLITAGKKCVQTSGELLTSVSLIAHTWYKSSLYARSPLVIHCRYPQVKLLFTGKVWGFTQYPHSLLLILQTSKGI